jgi:pilus assembly protein Flp/PilA
MKIGDSAMWHIVRRLAGNRRAATAVEYGLIAGLIVIAMVASLSNLAKVTSGIWNNVNDKVTNSH